MYFLNSYKILYTAPMDDVFLFMLNIVLHLAKADMHTDFE